MSRRGETHLVYEHIERGEAGVWIAFAPIAFYSRPHERLGEDEVRKVMYGEVLRVGAEELGDKPLEREEVNIGVWVEELEVDVDETLLACGSVIQGRREWVWDIRDPSQTRPLMLARLACVCPLCVDWRQSMRSELKPTATGKSADLGRLDRRTCSPHIWSLSAHVASTSATPKSSRYVPIYYLAQL